HLRSGCTLLHHNGFDDDGAEGARRAHIAIKTYLSTGIRLAFSPGVRDESKLAMGGEEFIETLPPNLKAEARPFVFFDKEVVADSYFRLFDELYEAYNSTETRILLAPCWAHGASETFLRRVCAKADERGGVMIHSTCCSRRCTKPMAGAGTESRRYSGSMISVWWSAMSFLVMRFT